MPEGALWSSVRTVFWLLVGMTNLVLFRITMSMSSICRSESRCRRVLNWLISTFGSTDSTAFCNAAYCVLSSSLWCNPKPIEHFCNYRRWYIHPRLCQTLETLIGHQKCRVLSGTHLTTGVYSMMFSLIRMSLGFSRSHMFFAKIPTNGLWSVHTSYVGSPRR